jgi:superfamily II helicase
MIIGETKVCTKCNFEKDLLLFSAKKTSKDGRSSWCRDCFKENWKQRYYENHAHYRNSHNASRNNIRDKNAQKVFEYLKNHYLHKLW